MDSNTEKKRYGKLAIVTTSTGAILIIISIIRGAMMVVAFANGIPVHTIRDVSLSVLNIAFDFVIPFVGGIILVAAGMALLEIEYKSIRTRSREEMKRTARSREIRITGKMLSDNDRVVLGLLSKNGSMLQSEIVVMSGFSKVKVHRIIRKLENINIVKSTRFGITNKVMLVGDKNYELRKKA
ncbi:MAG: winged helix-turn-helix transcriptional regulator [Candidatus Marsarchaeota archaeon]|nr:winged helix-turn-helix transcriptional regulator [Candidatus Marsarchaeota archaeon]MCL5101970.1 winged helix-turn-helix transcriptional regulator [Candidatus Marsarchaeota archaeon]